MRTTRLYSHFARYGFVAGLLRVARQKSLGKMGFVTLLRVQPPKWVMGIHAAPLRPTLYLTLRLLRLPWACFEKTDTEVVLGIS